MFRRSNKITALVVAAAAVVSLVPATGANAAAKRLGNKLGTVKEGIAYDGGKYSYYGYRDDNALTGIYFNNGGDEKDTSPSDLEDYRFDTLSKYGTKYAYAHEQSNEDEYLVDLSTGKIVDDQTKEERASHAKTDLVSNMKKADRYNGTDDLKNGDVNFKQILQGQFGEVWYQYDLPGHETTTTSAVAQSAATVTIPVLTKAQFDAKMNASNVATGFTTTVAGESYTFVANGSSVAQVTAKQIAISNDGLATPGVVAPNVNGLTPFAVTGAGIAYNGATYTAAAFPTKAGSFKTTIDGIVRSYDNYLAQQVSAGNLLRNNASGAPVAIASNGDLYELTPAVAGNVAKTAEVNAALAAKFTAVTNQFNDAVASAQRSYAAATNTSGSTLGTDYTAYVNFVNATIAAKIADADAANGGANAYTNNFAAYVPLNPASTTDQAKTQIVLTSNVDGAMNVASEKNALVSAFGSFFTDGGAAGTKTTTSTDTIYTGFSNEDGKYIDASYYANVKVFSQTKGRAVLVEKYDTENKDAELTVHLVSLNAVAQDKDYIYAIAELKVTGAGAVQETQYFLQKIAKAQGEKVDGGAYTPKSTTSYLLDNGIYEEGDLQKPLEVIRGEATEGANEHSYLLGMTVKDGNTLYVTRASQDNVKVYKFDLKASFKSDVVLGANLKTDVDTPAVKWNDATDEDINEFAESNAAEDAGLQGITPVKAENDTDQVELFNQKLWRHPAVSIDVNGNTWSVKKNTVTKFDGIDKKNDIYSVDGAMDAIDVYDDNSLIAWDTDGDRYTTIKEGTNVTENDGINVNPDLNKDKFKNGFDATEKKFYKDGQVVKSQWQSNDGKWYFVDENGALKTGWYKNAAGVWYLLGADGAMLTGWQQDGGNWYYLNPVNTSGAMVTGWFQDTTGTWYYTDGSGKMLSNTTVGGYTLGATGAWVK